MYSPLRQGQVQQGPQRNPELISEKVMILGVNEVNQHRVHHFTLDEQDGHRSLINKVAKVATDPSQHPLSILQSSG